jgi:hypothetical protein
MEKKKEKIFAAFDYNTSVSKKRYFHHTTFAALEASAAQDCQICSLAVDSTKIRDLIERVSVSPDTMCL